MNNKKLIKRKLKDSVFADLFSHKKYSLKLYEALHPEDKNVAKKDIKNVTIKTIVVNDIYNDLGMMVKDKVLFLLESQSTWSINILVRIFLYLAYTYKNYFNNNDINLYASKKVFVPMPELYVIYTGYKKIVKKEISLNEEFFYNKAPFDVKVKVISSSKRNDIIYQYIEFCRIGKGYIKKYGNKKSTIEKIIKECIRRNILNEYLIERREEVVDIMGILFDQDMVIRNYEKQLKNEARAEGMQQGMQQGMRDAIVHMFNNKKISAKEGAEYLGMSVKKFLELAG